MPKPIIAVTMGDPGGIGPEIILKSLKKSSSSSVYYLVLGFPEVFSSLNKKLHLSASFHVIPSFDRRFLRTDKINFLDISQEAGKILKKVKNKKSLPKMAAVAGKVSVINAAMAYAALDVAARLAADGEVSAIVTAPINKTSIRLIEPGFHGHTEFLARSAAARHFAMMFVSERLKVTLATIHVPIKSVSRLIKKELVYQKIRLTNEFLRKRFKIKSPRLAVCALNPHGKETGKEDEAQIAPAVKLARKKGMSAVGPLSADQLFHDAYEGRFDAVISMYHDQGLAPFKMIAFRDGVNVTLGLPYVRTSPDHGTAFDIAYQGKADPSSMKSAIDLAKKLLSA